MPSSTLVATSATVLAIWQCFLFLRCAQRPSTTRGEWVIQAASVTGSILTLLSVYEVTSHRLLSSSLSALGLFLAVTWYFGTRLRDSSHPSSNAERPLYQGWAKLFGWKATTAAPEPPFADLPYRPLADTQIRLLKFSEGVGSKDDTLRFDLFHAKLSEKPQYVALSYCWGDAGAQGQRGISVNGRKYNVSVNLAEGLYKLKQHNISTIWVDAICINQQDNVEKAREIVRMFTIYRTAQLVFIWLGMDTGPERDMNDLSVAISDIEKPTSRLNHNSAMGLELPALRRLLSQSYWRRVWIIQEVAAARQARIFWGSYTFDLHSIETLIRDVPSLNDKGHGSHNLAQKVISVRAACRAHQDPRLMEVLAMTTSSKTSVIRDKVYGLLGLASDWARFVQEPNYSHDVSENNLCREMTINHINWYSSADIIFLRSVNSHQVELPSWCPDYFHFQPHRYDGNLISYVCFKNPNLGWERRRAFGKDSPTMNEIVPNTFISNGNRLTLKGRLIGHISALGSVSEDEMGVPNHGDFVRGDTAIGESFRRLLLICHNQTFRLQPSSAFFSLLYALPEQIFRERGLTKVKRWLDLHRAFFEAFGIDLSPASDEYAFITRRGGGFSTSSKVLPEWKEFFSLNQDNTISRRGEHPLFSMLQSISSIVDEHMRLMYIHDEILLGWAHRDAMPGDSVWHLEGCTLQAILRKSKKLSEEHGECMYTLIGHAYVDPVMVSGRWMAKETGSRLVTLC